ncbi:MAG: serine/threonine-protein phosphatase [Phycisphaeraceae bacterium]|nr:MAG: serine/threonine-protein phosphatase [Phycisphaeraceae bacterium]
MTRAGEPSRTTLSCAEVWGGNRSTDTVVSLPGLEARVLSRPYRGQSAGGDVHYLSSCAFGRISRLLLADVSGHGDAVSGVAEGLRGLMRRSLNEVDQGRAFAALNREFSGLTKAGMFATAVMGTCWSPSGELTLSNAGHPRPAYFEAATGRWTVLGGGPDPRIPPVDAAVSDVPLGIEASSTYTQSRLRLAPGDLLLLYTDALTEARGESGRMIGESGLLELLRGLGTPDHGTLLGRVESALTGERGRPEDDLTMVLVRSTGAPPRMSAVEWVKGVGRLAGGWLGR